MILNAPRVSEVAVTGVPTGGHHLEVLLVRGRERNVINLISRSDTVYAVTTADGTPLFIAVPGSRYAELARRTRLTVE